MSETLRIARQVRRDLVQMMARSKSSHIGSCFSIVDALTVLYFEVLRVDPAQPQAPGRDRFVLSKAHASGALYAVLAERGFFPRALLDRYYLDGGTLPGHLDRTAVPGVETSGGSLGHGLALGIGMALAQRTDGLDARTFVLVGDGECNEGSVWEGVMLAPQLRLGNLTLLVDYNKIQSLGRTDEILDQRNMAERFRAFGWDVLELHDGHDHEALKAALQPMSERPRVLVLHTVKGKGVSFMEDKLLWHYRSPDPAEVERALRELDG